MLKTKIGRLRVLAYLEGISLLILVFIAVPLKYVWQSPGLAKAMGPVHGLFFLLFVINTVGVGIEQRWVFGKTTWKVLVACVIPFGTFYIDKQILRRQAV